MTFLLQIFLSIASVVSNNHKTTLFTLFYGVLGEAPQ